MRVLVLALCLAATPALANAPGGPAVEGILAEAGPGTRFGLIVMDAAGREIVAIDADDRFIPASNTKIYTTAATMWAAARGELKTDVGARVRLERAGGSRTSDVVLEGHGDTGLSAAADCAIDCLATLADAVAARTRRVGDVIGDATAFLDERWGPGMSWNNIVTRSGTATAALSLDANEMTATVTPGAVGSPPAIELPAYYTLDNRATTVPGDAQTLAFDRPIHGRTLLVTGTIGAAAKPEVLNLGIDDPAFYAAHRLAEMLRQRGVKVGGAVRSRYRPLLPADDPKTRGGVALLPTRPVPALATLMPPPLGETVTNVNKVSQNHYADLLLRRLGTIRGTGSIADGQAYIRAMLTEAGVPDHAVSLSDGSGMSTYNRVSPRGTARLLAWIARQPWGAEYRATLPVGGIDGTLAKRFSGTPLEGRIFAKTGTLNATNALAGYLLAASGKQLTFAIYANDVPEGVRATQFMDRALLAIAAAN